MMILTVSIRAAIPLFLMVPLRVGGSGQPIPFRHSPHVEQGFDCETCHRSDPYEDPGLPASEVCLTCHADGDSGSTAGEALRRYRRTGAEIPWARTHRTAEYVYFDHPSHSRARVSCHDCHARDAAGEYPVTEEDVAMASCVNCHLSRSASIACGLCHAQTLRQ